MIDMFTQCSSFRLLFLLLTTALFSCSNEKKRDASVEDKMSAYLFAYFTGNEKGEEAVHFALSDDGFNYKALNGNTPVISSAKNSVTGGLRDPHILRAADGKTFYMVATDMHVAENDWGPNYGMVLLKSTDLINWSSSKVNIPKTFKAFADVNRVWAPQSIYDPLKKQYMLYWSMRFGEEPDKIYYAYANDTFTGLSTEPKQLFFKPDNGGCIDGTIVFKDGKYHLFFKTEDEQLEIQKAVSNELTKGYVWEDKNLDQTEEAVEGADVFKLRDSDEYILMYDVYRKGKYELCKSKDLQTFEVVREVSMDFHPRHGTVMAITGKEAEALKRQFTTSP